MSKVINKEDEKEKEHIYNYCLDSFENIQGLIKFADQKSSGLLVIQGFLITIFINFFSDSQFVSMQKASFKEWLTFIFGLLFCITIIAQTLIIILKIIFPRGARNYENKDKCTFYYEHISKMDKSNFIELVKSENIDENINAIAGQVYEVSKILEKKHENIKNTVGLLILSVIFLVIYVILLKI
ncbi:MAG: Pycsar system effector family protein [Paraclostridium sp.]